ncbi:MAG: chromosome partitioning protein [Acidimicrobiaceae bacterium]|nr:chromosome partitioning protein [Acidimicrobiaceae bacterium]
MALNENDDVLARGRAIFDRLRGPDDAPEDVIGEAPAHTDPLPEDQAPATAWEAPLPEEPAPAAAPEQVASPPAAAWKPDIEAEAEAAAATPAPEAEAPLATPEEAEAPPSPDVESAAPDGPSVEVEAASGGPTGADEADAVLPAPSLDVDAAPAAVASVVAEAASVLTTSESSVEDGLATAEAADDPLAPRPGPLTRPLPRILAIANQKGGVGKTTTAVNLGAALAELGYRVLVVDLDPQGNATTGLGINPRTLEASIYDVLMHDTPLEDCIEPTSLRNLFAVPATIDLAGAEIELVPAFSRELKLRRALETVAEDFDYTLIDCPPSLGLITVNGLAAATEVVVPIQCEYYALEGLGQLLRNVSLVQGNLNPKLEVSAIILTMFDARTKLAEQVASEVRAHFGEKVCRNIVPRTVRLSEAPSFGQPIVVFDPTSRGAIAYRELAKEVSGGAPQRVG